MLLFLTADAFGTDLGLNAHLSINQVSYTGGVVPSFLARLLFAVSHCV